MRVAAPPCDPDAVYNIRTKWHVDHLADTGQIDFVHLDDGLQVRQAMRRHGPSEIVGAKSFPDDVDVLVLTRVLAGRLVELIPVIQSQGTAVVVDIDDDFRHAPPMLKDREKINPRLNPGYNWRHMAKACAIANFVTCSTPALLRYAPHGRAAVVRNAVPSHYLTIEIEREPGLVGWTGAAQMHPGDLEVTHGGVAHVCKEVGSRFTVIGPHEGVDRRLGLNGVPYDVQGGMSHGVYPYRMAKLDVCICPLSDNNFTLAKSWIKPLEATALGVNWVGSATPEYTKLLSELSGAPWGRVVRPRAREWRKYLLEALRMPEEERQERCLAARAIVRERHTVPMRSSSYLEAWQAAIDHRRGR